MGHAAGDDVPRTTIRLDLPDRRVLDLYAGTGLDFEDCVIVAQLEHAGLTHLASFDRGFDVVLGITRVEP